jgi:hypothetical protein
MSNEIKVLEEGSLVEQDFKRVRLSELQKSLVDFESTLGKFKLEDLVCGVAEREAIEHVMKNGFTPLEESYDCIQKMEKIKPVTWWIQENDSDISTIDSLLRSKKENIESIDFINDLQEMKLLEKNKNDFIPKVGFINGLMERFSKSDSTDRVKALFTNEKGEKLSEIEIDEKIENAKNKVEEYIKSTRTYYKEAEMESSIERVYKEKLEHVSRILDVSKNSLSNYEDKSIMDSKEDYLVKHSDYESKLIERKGQIETQIEQSRNQIINIDLSDELKSNVEKEILFATMAENNVYYPSNGEKPSKERSVLSDIYGETMTALTKKQEQEQKQEVELELPNLDKRQEQDFELPNINKKEPIAIKKSKTQTYN